MGTQPTASALAGNWLLAGPLPEIPVQTTIGTELSVTVSTVGDQLVGLGQFSFACGSTETALGPAALGAGGGFTATGTVAADGSFVLQSPSTTTTGVAITSVTISGKVPASAGESWSGTYAINPNGDGGCSVQQSGTIAAQAIAPLTGTYVATGTYADGSSATPVTATMVLTQGVTSTEAGGVLVDTAYELSGTITVDGVPCFKTGVGVTPLTPEPRGVGGSVFGGLAVPEFKMDDGSLLTVNLDVNDFEAMQLDGIGAGVFGGNCGSSLTAAGPQLRLGNFSRQS